MRQTLLFLSFSILALTSCQKSETIDSNISARPGGGNGGGGSTVNLTQGLVAFYPFNGNANDASGNGNNGTVNGATLTTDRFNRRNRAYDFNGENNYIRINNSYSLSSFSSISISSWINASSLSQVRMIVSRWNNDNNNRAFQFLSYNSQLSCNISWDGSQDSEFCLSSNYLSLNNWIHTVMVFSNNNMIKIYVNGILDSEATINTNGVFNPSTPFFIGAREINNGIIDSYFNGKLDDIRIYNRALNQAEITYLARN